MKGFVRMPMVEALSRKKGSFAPHKRDNRISGREECRRETP